MIKRVLFVCFALTLCSGLLGAEDSPIMKALLYIESPAALNNIFVPGVTKVTIGERKQTPVDAYCNGVNCSLRFFGLEGKNTIYSYYYDIEVETGCGSRKFSFESCNIYVYPYSGEGLLLGDCRNKNKNDKAWTSLEQFKTHGTFVYDAKVNQRYEAEEKLKEKQVSSCKK